jgi:hypothetical protein
VFKLNNKDKIDILKKIAGINNKFRKTKENPMFSNVSLGRTFSIGPWVCYYFGLKLAELLPKYHIVIDVAITEMYKNLGKKRKKIQYPDILIMKEMQGFKLTADEKIIKQNNIACLKKNKDLICNAKNPHAKINPVSYYRVEAIMEIKTDPGYLRDEVEFKNSLNWWVDSIENERKFVFRRNFHLSEKDEDNFAVLDILQFKKNTTKHLVFGCFENHQDRIKNYIKNIAANLDIQLAALVKDSIHIRKLRGNRNEIKKHLRTDEFSNILFKFK